MKKKTSMTIAVIVSVIVVLMTAHGWILENLARMTVKQDEIGPADVIVVLAGEQSERVDYGVELFRRGLSTESRIIMAGGPIVWKYSWADLMKEQALSMGVPAESVILEDRSLSTEEDALFTGEILERNGYDSIILVTSPYHSRRADLIFRRVLGKNRRVISAPVKESWLKYEGWWKRRRDRAMILNEFSKYVWLLFFGVGRY